MSISTTRMHRLLFALAVTGALVWPVNTAPLADGHHGDADDGDHGPGFEVGLCLEACDLFEEACPATCDSICGADAECSVFCLPSCADFADSCRTDCTGGGEPPDDDDDDGDHHGDDDDDRDDDDDGDRHGDDDHDRDDDDDDNGGKRGRHDDDDN